MTNVVMVAGIRLYKKPNTPNVLRTNQSEINPPIKKYIPKKHLNTFIFFSDIKLSIT
jgi:hypothetical protein